MFNKKKSEVTGDKEIKEGVDYFVTDDGRRVSYLQNPLPVPPKRNRKSMNFASDFIDDFDIEISADDDFDI